MPVFKVKEIRTQKGMSQEELAKKSNVSRTTISGLESGSEKIANTDTLARIAQALGVDVGDIFLLKEFNEVSK